MPKPGKRWLAVCASLLMVFTSVTAAYSQPADEPNQQAADVMGEWMSKGVITGDSGGSVQTEQAVTRAEFVDLLDQVFGFTETAKVTFTDVPESAWYYDAISKALAAGIISGNSESVFRPEAAVTRPEAEVILSRIFSLLSGNGQDEGVYDDVFGKPGIRVASGAGITRAESLVVIGRVVSRLELAGGDHKGGVKGKLIADLEAAAKAAGEIAALPVQASVTLADEPAITSARADYDALTAFQKALVGDITRLTDAETQLANLKAAAAVANEIAALPVQASVTLADQLAVLAVRAHYNALTAAQQPLVGDITKLTDAEARIAELKSQAMVKPYYAIANGGFESALSGWGTWKSSEAADISVVSGSKEGSSSVKLFNASGSQLSIWNSSLLMNGKDNMPAAGDTVQIGAWIKVGADADTTKSFALHAFGWDGTNKTPISGINSLAGIQPDTWTYVVSPVGQVPAGQQNVTLAVEESIPGTVQVDDVRVFHSLPSYAIGNGSFESGLTGWGTWKSSGNAVISTVTDAKEGSSSVKLVNASGSQISIWNSTLLTNGTVNMPAAGDTVQIGAWIKVGADADTTKSFALHAFGWDGTNKTPISGIFSLAGIQPDTWTYVVSPVGLVPAGQQNVTVAVEENVPGTIQVDDIRVFHYPPAYALGNGGFESALAGWSTWKSSAAADISTVADAKTGSSSLKLYNSTGSLLSVWNTTLQLNGSTGMPAAGDMMQVGAWVKLGADADTSKSFTLKGEGWDGSKKTPIVNLASLAGIPNNTWTYVVTPVGQIPAGQTGITVAIEENVPGTVQVDDIKVFNYTSKPVIQNSSISPSAANFDKNPAKQSDLSIAMTLNGNSLTKISDGAVPLVQGTDYTLSGSTVSIRKEYLAGLSTGLKKLTFSFNAGLEQTLNINIIDSTFDVPGDGVPYTMVSPGFEDYTTPDNDFSWGIYPTPLYGVGSNPPWSGTGIGVVTGSYNGAPVHSGDKALAMTNGGALWQRVYQKDGVKDGDIVQAEAWVYAFPGTIGFKLQIDALDSSDTHTDIAESRAITADDQGKWVLLQTNSIKSVPAGSVDGLVIAANSQTGNILLDDFAIRAIGHETPTGGIPSSGPYYPQLSVYPLQNGDFESGSTTSWGTWGNIAITNSDAYYGGQSVKFTIDPTKAYNNTDNTRNTAIWQGVGLGTDPDAPKAGQAVEAGAWIYLSADTDLASGSVNVQVESVVNNTPTVIAKSADLNPASTPKGQWIYVKTDPVNGGIISADASYIQVSIQNTITGTVLADFIQVGQAGAVNGNPQKMAFFTYQPWYGNPADGGPSDSWYNWSWQGGPAGMNHDPSVIAADGHRDIASVLDPIVGAYDSRDPQLLQYQFDIAKAAHADGFMINDYGRVIKQNYRKAENIMFDIADRMGMKLTLQYEPKVYTAGWVDSSLDRAGQMNGVKDDLEYILRTYATRKSFLKYNGIPVISIFGTSLVTNDEWAQILNTIRADGLGDIILMADSAPGSPLSYSTFGSTYNWHMMSSATDPTKSPTYDGVNKWAVGNDKGSFNWVNGDLQHRFGVGLVFPGFNDTGVGGNWGSGTPRIADYLAKDDPSNPWMGPADPKGDTLQATQNAVMAGGVNWILYATFNDWNESTVIEPSVQFGYKFMKETKDFLEQFKGLQSSDDNVIQQITENYINTRTNSYK